MIDKKLIIEKILRHLKSVLGDEIYEDFIEQMKYDNIVISGSTILQIIYGEKWKINGNLSDLDVFIKKIYYTNCCENHYNFGQEGYVLKCDENTKNITIETDEYKIICYIEKITYYVYGKFDKLIAIDFYDLKNNIYHENPNIELLKTFNIDFNCEQLKEVLIDPYTNIDHVNNITPIEAILYKNFAIQPHFRHEDLRNRYGVNFITKIRNYAHRINQYVVQIIHINHDNVSSFINSTFDFPILKNMFGRHANGEFYLEFAAENDIETRSTMITNTNNLKSIHRAYKYQNNYNIKITFPIFNDEFQSLFALLEEEYKKIFEHIMIWIVVYDDAYCVNFHWKSDDNNSLRTQYCMEWHKKYNFVSALICALSDNARYMGYCDYKINYIKIKCDIIRRDLPIINDKEYVVNEKFVEKYVRNKPELNSKYGIKIVTDTLYRDFTFPDLRSCDCDLLDVKCNIAKPIKCARY